MSVRFIIGRAGSGKTAYCVRAICETLSAAPLGAPIFWIVPRQATLTAERLLTCESGLGGFCRVNVLSLDRLGMMLLAEQEEDGPDEIPIDCRRMIIALLLERCREQLRFFTESAGQPGLAAVIDHAIGELDPWGEGPQAIAEILARLFHDGRREADADAMLADKLRDLHLLYGEYSRWISPRWRDPRSRPARIVQAIGKCPWLREAEIYLDGHTQFTIQQRRIVTELARVCRRMHITLLMDPESRALREEAEPDDLSVFHPVERTYLRLRKAMPAGGIDIEEPVVLAEPRRFRSAVLGAIERGMSGQAVEACSAEAGSVELVEAPDRRSEVEHAVRRVCDMLREGLRMRDIAVIVRDLEPYRDLLSAAFREHGVRCFIDRPGPLSHHPLVRLVRAVLAIAASGWEHQAAMTLIKTGLAGLSDDEADRIENYVLEHGLSPQDWLSDEPWQRGGAGAGAPDDDTPVASEPGPQIAPLRRRLIEAMEPLSALFARTERAATGKEAATALWQTLERMRVRETLAEWISRDNSARPANRPGEHEQAWEQLVAALDHLADLPDDLPLTAGQMERLLAPALDEFALAMSPPTVDEVFVGQIDRSHIPEVNTVMLLGMNEGEFPRPGGERSLLADSERYRLRGGDLEMDEGSRRRLLDERLLGYMAFTRASCRLYVSRSLSDEAGRPQGPSPFWTFLRRMLPHVPVRQVPRDLLSAPDLISTRRHLLEYLMLGARAAGKKDPFARPTWASLYSWLASGEADERSLERARIAWRALSCANEAGISHATAAALFGNPLMASPAQMEKFAACPFRHFAQYGLKLRLRPEAGAGRVYIGRACYGAAETIIERLRRLNDRTLADDELRRLADDAALEAEAVLGGEALPPGRLAHEKDRVGTLAADLLRWQRAVSTRSDLVPAFGGVRFGEAGSLLPPLEITTPRNRRLLLCGRMDRIDALRNAGALVVFDHRLTAYGKLDLDWAYHGLAVELLVYMLVIREHGRRLAGKEVNAAGAFYFGLLRGLRKSDNPDDEPPADSDEFALAGKPRGIFDGQYLGNFDRQIAPGASSGVVNARLNTDGRIGNRDRSDAVETSELDAILDHTRTQLAKLADMIMDGVAAVKPFYINGDTPCPGCPYRAVCRFDLSINEYRTFPRMKRSEVFDELTSKKGDAHA